MCPSFGWDEYCTHRVKRIWADALCDAGHVVIRLDLPGTGESAGCSRDPERLDAWIAAVSTAANWLVSEAECARIVGFGIGLGGLLAWAAAAQGAPIDDFMLWATPTRGRRLVREARAASKLNIDSKLVFESAHESEVCADAPEIGDDLLDEAGQISTAETLDALSRIDLTAMPLANPRDRRALIFMRPDNGSDEAVRAFFTEIGADVSVADGDGYGAMMQYVQSAETPERAVAQSVTWIDAAPSLPASERPYPGGLPQNAELSDQVLELSENGVAIRERPISLVVDGAVNCGVITEPVGTPAVGVCAVFFSGGSDRRIGPNRMWVETARRFASRGVHAVRIDAPGLGESDGNERSWDKIAAHYHPRRTDWAVSLLDTLVDAGLPDKFVLSGFCVGSYRSFRVADRDPRVAGIFAIGMPMFFSRHWNIRVRDSWAVNREQDEAENLKQRIALPVIHGGVKVMSSVRWGVLKRVHRHSDRALRALNQHGGSRYRGIDHVQAHLKRASRPAAPR